MVLVSGLAGLVASPAVFAKKDKGGAPAAPVPSEIYSLYDKNGNGTLEADEKDAIRAAYTKDPTGTLKAYDTNNDSKLSDDEIAAIPATKAVQAPEKKHKKNK
jgi:hypothetical protein